MVSSHFEELTTNCASEPFFFSVPLILNPLHRNLKSVRSAKENTHQIYLFGFRGRVRERHFSLKSLLFRGLLWEVRFGKMGAVCDRLGIDSFEYMGRLS